MITTVLHDTLMRRRRARDYPHFAIFSGDAVEVMELLAAVDSVGYPLARVRAAYSLIQLTVRSIPPKG